MSKKSADDPLVGPYLSNPATSAMTVVWIRGDDAECAFTLRSPDGSTREIPTAPARPIEGSSDHYYQLRLDGLQAGSRYEYSLRCPGGEHSAGFRTLPEDPDSFNFIYYGDNKSAAGTHRKVGLLFEQHDPLFAMHSGDMTDHGKYEEYKTYFFDPIRDVVDHIPLLVGRGNHEGDGKAYRQVFPLPDGDTWYSFDCGCAHFIVLDTTGWRHAFEKDDVPRMYEWLEADLAAAAGAAWKIVMYHEPSYDLGWRKDDWGHGDFLPLMRRGGVDLTFSGHAHGYQRLRPMVARGENEGHPITHIISAGAGASIGTKLLEESPFLVADARRFNYMPITVEPRRLHARVLSDDDEPIDEFELLKKPDGACDDSLLKQALWAEDYGRPGPPVPPYA
jgi:hypothetical protein